jgi:hypothetical protein
MKFISEAQAGEGGEKVETVSLDQFSKGHSIDRIDLLKIDGTPTECRHCNPLLESFEHATSSISKFLSRLSS